VSAEASKAKRMRAWRDGLLYTASLSPPYLVFGAVCGISAKQAGMTLTQAILLPALVFGGSAQVVLTSLLLTGAPVIVVILSAVIINSRMAIYSAIFSRWMKGFSPKQRASVAPLLVDQTYAAAVAYRQREGEANTLWLSQYYVAGFSLWLYWVLCNGIGFLAGNIVPASWQLDFAVPLSFVAVLAPLTKRVPMAVAAALGALLSLLFFALPLRLGLIAACMVGVCVMLLLDKKMQWTPPPSGPQ
jgi:4-azaleucine resistance transporter AzlC